MWLSALLLSSLALAAVAGETVNFDIDTVPPGPWTNSFAVDYMNDQFLLDGQPFRYVSGSFHYFRTPQQYWRDRLRKMRAAGLNAVSTYVEWSLHQPEPNRWHWTGDADLLQFLKIAQQEDLLVLLRPGPYICAERDLGGLPPWLLSLVPDIRLRTRDERYMFYVEQYLNVLLEKVRPFLRGNGGPIIMVQVENEYGSYNACDTVYMNRLRNFMNDRIGTNAVLYTTDGSSAGMLRCGFVPGAYATVDFGTSTNVTRAFEIMRLFQPRGPLVNSEFYPGWLTHWQEPFQRVATKAVAKTLDEMLAVGASVNIYMFYGGTNFAYTSGANGGEGSFSPQLTSYDYDAPLTEAGDPTDKYFEIRNVIAKYLPVPNMTTPVVAPKGNYGPVLVEPVVRLFDNAARLWFGTQMVRAEEPPTFEALNIPNLFVLYETTIPPSIFVDPLTLTAFPRDRALVYVDNRLSGILSRTSKVFSMPISDPYARDLKILVENQGHLNFGNEIHDFKGINNVKISDVPIRNWNVTGFKIDSVTDLYRFENTELPTGTLRNGPMFLRGHFTVNEHPMDTYLDTTGWGKGVAFINGHNLGRYWPLAGPQMTLYVPATYLRMGDNVLVLLEMEYVPSTQKMKLQDTPILNAKVNRREYSNSANPNGNGAT